MHDPVLESHHLVCEKPQTRRGIERRLALLLSATELFLEKGYDAVSLDDIVNHAGGSKTSIYKYFGNKDGLAYLLQSAIIAVKCFLKISVLHFNQSKLL
ncbi:TetR/AcrR family transcriptional regulator [Acinetobacter baumannii]|nr:TetR/AcrR family transcriptional regulator [Acinetobacter baumannii]EJN6995115.1 TetR/AcrR family transcriptional regulator [Acinetobacter baumannii]EKU6783723.1 TetR/AcrR family transcriptional regulator [Acinetobacter baumannii]EKW5025863.1 TetR/AcrR family transcriptional regulator [Acinetobacter baumannii]EKW5039183.1 TetR/AcrR family transcriptional regulator [Acinetobacter baumannii]